MEVFFGWGLKFGQGSWPSVAMNANKEMVMAHVPSGSKLAYRQGTYQHATVAWTDDEPYADGREPSIAISRTHALAVHRGEKNNLTYYWFGTLSNGRIVWQNSGDYDKGLTPSVAINDNGIVVEVHQSENTGRLWYNIGLIQGNTIDWRKRDDFADGSNPSVSLNNLNQVVVTYIRDNAVYYRLATTDGMNITFLPEGKVADGAGQASAAITDREWVVVCFNQSTDLMQRAGGIGGSVVNFGDPVKFDEGAHPSVAAQEELAVQVHSSQNDNGEFFTTSIITDRSYWMTERMAELGNLPLSELILPGSHDAAMYEVYDPVSMYYSLTQDKNLYQQLTYGQRWFDLRVIYTPLLLDLYIHHGESLGPKLTNVLDDVRKFKEKGGNKELVILKFSHFSGSSIGTFGPDDWNLMVNEIESALGPWLYRGPLPPNKERLADLTLTDYNGSVLVVVDNDWAIDYPHAGYWVYRDAKSDDPLPGQLRVWDKYSETDDYETMKKQQLQYFNDYKGKCKDGETDCDLFLLSWTLTPGALSSTVWTLAHTPNQHLGDEVGKLPVTNASGKIINIALVDYVQYARPSDVAIAEKDTGGTNR